jgi:DNA-binding LacI/PurR family transcriptional regulator
MNRIRRPAVVWRTIAEHYRAEIRSGALGPGDKLATARDMAKRFRTSVFTVQHAMDFLVHEGYIARGHGIGTVVLERVDRLARVGIAVYTGEWVPETYWKAATLLAEKLEAAGCRPVTLLERHEAGGRVDHLLETIRSLDIQGLIALNAPDEALASLAASRIPLVANSPLLKNRRVEFGSERFCELAVRAMREEGRRRPALVTSFPEGQRADFLARAAAAGMDAGPASVGVVRGFHENDLAENARRAFEAVRRMLSRPAGRRPDALAVFPDDILPGVVQAVCASGLRVPEDLLLVLYRNVGVPKFVSIPAVWIETDLDAAAAAMVDMLGRVFLGETVRPVRLPCRFAPRLPKPEP